MKKLFSLTLGLFLCVQGFANDGALFQLDEKQIDQDFAQLNQLENYVETHNGVSLNEVKSSNPEVLSNLADDPKNFQSLGSTLSAAGENPLGIPAFVWGCVLGWVGILVVYLIAEDRELTKQAFYGCLVGGVAWLIFYLIYVVALGAAFF